MTTSESKGRFFTKRIDWNLFAYRIESNRFESRIGMLYWQVGLISVRLFAYRCSLLLEYFTILCHWMLSFNILCCVVYVCWRWFCAVNMGRKRYRFKINTLLRYNLTFWLLFLWLCDILCALMRNSEIIEYAYYRSYVNGVYLSNRVKFSMKLTQITRTRIAYWCLICEVIS